MNMCNEARETRDDNGWILAVDRHGACIQLHADGRMIDSLHNPRRLGTRHHEVGSVERRIRFKTDDNAFGGRNVPKLAEKSHGPVEGLVIAQSSAVAVLRRAEDK